MTHFNAFTICQIPLIAGFASAYAEVNAEQTQEVFYLFEFSAVDNDVMKVVRTFYTSLQCDLQCRDMEDADLKAECQAQFCKEEEEEEVK